MDVVINQVNSYYEPEEKQCDDTSVAHGNHIYMRKNALGLRVWYECEGFTDEDPDVVEVVIEIPLEEGPNV